MQQDHLRWAWPMTYTTLHLCRTYVSNHFGFFNVAPMLALNCWVYFSTSFENSRSSLKSFCLARFPRRPAPFLTDWTFAFRSAFRSGAVFVWRFLAFNFLLARSLSKTWPLSRWRIFGPVCFGIFTFFPPVVVPVLPWYAFRAGRFFCSSATGFVLFFLLGLFPSTDTSDFLFSPALFVLSSLLVFFASLRFWRCFERFVAGAPSGCILACSSFLASWRLRRWRFMASACLFSRANSTIGRLAGPNTSGLLFTSRNAASACSCLVKLTKAKPRERPTPSAFNFSRSRMTRDSVILAPGTAFTNNSWVSTQVNEEKIEMLRECSGKLKWFV